MVEVDDDVVDAPAEWDATLLDAFERLPHIGFLAADLEDDPHDVASQVRRHETAGRVHPGGGERRAAVEVRPAAAARSPRASSTSVPAASASTPRRSSGSRTRPTSRTSSAGIRRPPSSPTCACTTPAGPYYSVESEGEGPSSGSAGAAHCARRAAVKRMLLRIPERGRSNARFGWFVAPSWRRGATTVRH